jgi:hypothetical protein
MLVRCFLYQAMLTCDCAFPLTSSPKHRCEGGRGALLPDSRDWCKPAVALRGLAPLT